MYLIDVIPISRGIGSEVLSYYSKEKVTPGSLVKVELRNKLTSALVLSLKSVEDSKAEIRSARFELKKIRSVSPQRIIRDEAIEAAQESARFFCATTGAVLNHLIPKSLLEAKLEAAEDISVPHTVSEGPGTPEKLILQADDEDRIAHYKRLIRESFARGASVFLCVPTTHNASWVRDSLSRGIEEYTFTFHGSLPKKEVVRLWQTALSVKHPVLVIGTGLFLALPRRDIGTIIMEREHSSAYRTQSRPFLDFRSFVELYATKTGARIIFGDSLLRIETLWRGSQGEFSELAPIKFRSLSKAHQSIIDMRPYRKESGGQFEVFSRELKETLSQADTLLKKTILFVTRRGLATQTICGDCGNIVKCHTCGHPTILHKSSAGAGANFFLCHTCGERRDAHERCAFCTSWKLVPLGIGTERVEEEAKKLFPGLPCFRLDGDTAKTHTAAARIVKDFNAASKGVLIGNEMLLHQNIEPVESSAIVTLDALFSVPDFRIHEKIVHLILAVRSLSKSTFMLQTRNPEEELLNDAITGHLANFYRRELEMREKFHYPPFSTLIKITVEGTKKDCANIFEALNRDIQPRTIDIFPAYIKAGAGRQALHGVIKLPRKEWVDPNLFRILSTLPRGCTVAINPESIL